MAWRPGRHRAALALEAPYEDVPDHLAQPLWDWIQGVIEREYDPRPALTALGLHLRIPLPQDDFDAIRALSAWASDDPGFMLDLVEACFLLRPTWEQREGLQRILAAANSMYRLNDAANGLEVVVLPETKDAVQRAVNEAPGSAGEHLANAWSLAYGRQADPVKAYSEAIKAVEAAAAPTISPKHLKATLGSMIGDLKGNTARWIFVIEGDTVDAAGEVQHLMSLLWEGQTSRHGGVRPTVPETVQAARAAVHIAATLVQFFVSGAIAKR